MVWCIEKVTAELLRLQSSGRTLGVGSTQGNIKVPSRPKSSQQTNLEAILPVSFRVLAKGIFLICKLLSKNHCK